MENEMNKDDYLLVNSSSETIDLDLHVGPWFWPFKKTLLNIPPGRTARVWVNKRGRITNAEVLQD